MGPDQGDYRVDDQHPRWHPPVLPFPADGHHFPHQHPPSATPYGQESPRAPH